MKTLILIFSCVLISCVAHAQKTKLIPGTEGSNPGSLTLFDDKLVFGGDIYQYSRTLWTYDETADSPTKVSLYQSWCDNVTAVGKKMTAVLGGDLYFTGEYYFWPAKQDMPALFKWNGKDLPVKVDFNPFASPNPSNLCVYNDKLYCVMDTFVRGQLWEYTPATDVGRRVTNIVPGYIPGWLPHVTVFKDKLYFIATTSAGGYPMQAMAYDPATGVTTAVPMIDTNLLPWDDFTVIDGKMYFIAGVKKSPKEFKLCVYDGVNPIKALVALYSDDPNWSGFYQTNIVGYKNKIYFRGIVNQLRTWTWNPATEQANEVKVLNGYDVTNAHMMVVYHGKLYFSAPSTLGNITLYSFDGEHAPSIVDSTTSDPREAIIYKDNLYFTAKSPAGKLSLYRYFEADSSAINSITDPIVYPNPANGVANFSFMLGKDEPLSFIVMDVTGKTVFRKPIAQYNAGLNKISFDVGNFSHGFYYCRLSNEQNEPVAGAKLIKE